MGRGLGTLAVIAPRFNKNAELNWEQEKETLVCVRMGSKIVSSNDVAP